MVGISSSQLRETADGLLKQTKLYMSQTPTNIFHDGNLHWNPRHQALYTTVISRSPTLKIVEIILK